ncbi:hypothetical protein GWK47_041151 [Chionoecetes opilio]|uniref:SGNH hydrolase-type esterase domain-containing protein n=1 Tax=Chionoecetes opilio TaxID=41210 RepID=A0A8J4YHA4_CHIOP|nr:hypothetical protein GWK47_041151 [Chionoecetes opilio]
MPEAPPLRWVPGQLDRLRCRSVPQFNIISEQIHEQRRCQMPREPGVGAELTSPPNEEDHQYNKSDKRFMQHTDFNQDEKSVLEAIDDLKRYFISEVNDLKSVVRKQEIEIRSLKCGGGVSGGTHARDVPGGVPEGDVPRATTKGVVSSKSPKNGEWQVVEHGGTRPKEKKINNDHVVCTNAFQVLSGLQEEDTEVRTVDDTSSPEGKILVVGDSQVRHLDSRFCDREGMRMKSVSYSGKGLGYVRDKIVECMADQRKKSIVCLSAGGNDVEGVSSEELLRQFKEAVCKVRDRGGFPVVCGVLPRRYVDDLWYSRAIALNCRLALHCKANGWAFVCLGWDRFFWHNHLYHRDGVHFSRKGVQILSESLERECR